MLKKILITIGLLCAYRLFQFVPLPGLDMVKMSAASLFFAGNDFSFINYINIFNRSGIVNFSVVAFGLQSFLGAYVIMQLMAFVIPALKRMKLKDSLKFTKTINGWIFALTGIVGLFQCFAVAFSLGNYGYFSSEFSYEFTVLIVTLTLLTGVFVTVWIGLMINQFGIGQGISLIMLLEVLGLLQSNYAGFVGVGTQKIVGFVLCLLVFAGLLIFVLNKNFVINVKPNNDAEPHNAVSKISVPYHLAGAQAISQNVIIISIMLANILMMQLNKLFIDVSGYYDLSQWIYYGIYLASVLFLCYFWVGIVFSKKHFMAKLGEHKLNLDHADNKTGLKKLKSIFMVNAVFGWGAVLLLFSVIPLVAQKFFGIYLEMLGVKLFIGFGLIYFFVTHFKLKSKKIVLCSYDLAELLINRAKLTENGIETKITDQDYFARVIGLHDGLLAKRYLVVDENNADKALALLKT